MKKVKFTLGLALAMLFVGANVVSASSKWEPEKTDKGYVAKKGNFEVSLSIAPSPSFVDSVINNAITLRDSAFIDPEEDSVNHGYFNGRASLPTAVGALDKDNIRKTSYDSRGSGDLSALAHPFSEPYAQSIDSCITNGLRLHHLFTVKLNYKDGNEAITYLRMTIMCGKWMYDSDRDSNVWVESHALDGIVLPYSTTEKTDFTYGTGIATYRYSIDLMPLFLQYPIHSIHYELWTNDMFDGGGDSGDGIKNQNNTIRIDAAAGITTNPASDDIIPIAVPSGTDLTLDVTGEAGKELEVTTSDRIWSVDNGGVKIVPNGAGKWTVTIVKVSANMTIKIGYKATTESGSGEDGQTGNGTFTGDAVWGSGGTLYVKSANAGTLSIYNVTGKLCKQVSVSGDYTVTMPKGLYIVQLNGKAYKVVL